MREFKLLRTQPLNAIEVQALLKEVDATGLTAEELIRRALQAALRH